MAIQKLTWTRNVKDKTVKLWENTRENIPDLKLSEDFLDITWKGWRFSQ